MSEIKKGDTVVMNNFTKIYNYLPYAFYTDKYLQRRTNKISSFDISTIIDEFTGEVSHKLRSDEYKGQFCVKFKYEVRTYYTPIHEVFLEVDNRRKIRNDKIKNLLND